MSRRKQSNPRQIKRSFGEMEEGAAAPAEESSPAEQESAASDHDGFADCEDSSPPGSEEAESKEASENPKESKKEEPGDNPQEPNPWNGPDELELVALEGDSRVCARRSLPEGLSWGPYPGNIHSEPASPGQSETSLPVMLILGDERCWLSRLPLVSGEAKANSVIYRKDESLWCKTTQAIAEKELLRAFVIAEPQGIPNHTVKSEPGDPTYPATLHSDIQLLPQQAGMAAILATAVVNKDVFPCKDCGIWYRSERNLQAHLMYYCASRQTSSSPSVEEKPKETYPNERICPFPQCKKSCPSASSLEIHMRSHSGERPFVCLICLSAFTTKANCERHLKVHTDTLNGVCHSCGFISTTRDILYSHLVTSHMICQPGSKGEVYSPGPGLPTAKPPAPGPSQPSGTPSLKCSLCSSVADSLASLRQHMVLHSSLPAGPEGAEPTPALAPARPDSPARAPAAKLSPAGQVENGEARVPQAGSCPSSSSEPAPPLRIKEEPSDSPRAETEAAKGNPLAEPAASPRSDPEGSSRASSPRSLHSVKVKSELASPTPGSSPVPSEPGAAPAGATIFLPQYVFGHEASVVPQASEILAKMSELVHSRLKQGHGAVPPALYPSAPLPKGATCFECDITFNNINNYYVHKRLYCSSRRLAEDSPPGARKPKATPTTPKGPATPGALLSPAAAIDRQAPPCQGGEAERDASPPAAEAKAEPRAEDGGAKASSPEADGAGRASEDSQSPSSSVDEADEDPSKTVCEACSIRFSRHETYMVHKRFYCASRHDPPLRRPSAPKAPFLPQPVRTRKRRKLYEIHGATGPALGPALPLAEQLAGAGDPLAGGARPEVPPVLSALISVAKVPGAAPSPSSSPDAEGPIDLSKKSRLQGEPVPPSLLPLGDYHECTACRISFHSLDGYLAHKKYYCPAVPLQAGALEQLHKLKGAGPPPAKCRSSREPPEPQGEELGGVRVKVERAVPSVSPGTLVAKPLALPAAYASGADSLQRYASSKSVHLPLAGCPYCPLNGAVKGDLIEHFHHAHGLFLAKPGAGPGAAEPGLQAAPRTPSGCTPESSLPPRPAASPPQPLARLRKDSFSSKELAGFAASNGSPLPTSSPVSPAAPVPVSPAPEAVREPSLNPAAPPPPTKALPSPSPNSNHRYCRLCNIKFSSLSTFIAHKKYYCSSHAAEHVK